MTFFQTFNTHSLRTTMNFKLKSGDGKEKEIQNIKSRYDMMSPFKKFVRRKRDKDEETMGRLERTVSTHKDIKEYVEQSLGSNNTLELAVKLPEDEDYNEWLAVHVVDFYNQLNMIFGIVSEFCTEITCPKMCATDEYEYLWQDVSTNRCSADDKGGASVKSPISLPASIYIDNLMTWVEGSIENENIFPSKLGAPFPQNFESLVKVIFKRLFRIYAHIYCHHFHEINRLNLQTLLNTSLKHFILFSNEFNLILKQDYAPLEDLINNIL